MTSIAIIDRFTLNLWPIFLSHPLSPIFSDFITICWIFGRELIVSSSFINVSQIGYLRINHHG